MGKDWYYLVDGQSRGPVSEDELARLHHEKQVSTGTLIWKLGADAWRPLAELFPQMADQPPPLPAASQSAVEDNVPSLRGITRVSPDPAGQHPSSWVDERPHPWRRYFARMLDTVLHGTGLFFVFGMLVGYVAPGSDIFSSPLFSNRAVSAFLTGMIVIPINGLLIGYTGGSIGKWLFGIRVLTLENGVPGFSIAFQREGVVWARGLGLWIPIVNLITLITSFRTLVKNGRTYWDDDLKLKAVHRPMGFGQVVGSLFGIFVIVALIVGLQILDAK